MNYIKILYLNISFCILSLIVSAIALPYFIIFLLSGIIISKRNGLKNLRLIIRYWGALLIKIAPLPLIRVKYKDLSPGDNKYPSIFVINHRSMSDAFLLACLPGEIIQVAKDWPLRLPGFSFVARAAGYLNIEKLSFKEFSNDAADLVRNGVSIAIFPEGTRSGNKTIGQFHSAIFRVAKIAKAQIVPVCITGNENIPPIGSVFLRPGIIKVRKLPALKYSDFKDMTPFILKNKVRDIMIKKSKEMYGDS